MLNEKTFQEETVEISLIDLFWSVLCRWKVLLIGMIAAGILLAGYGAYKEYKVLTDKKAVKERQETYESDLETYTVEKEKLEKKLERQEETLARLQFYQDNSIMLKIDQYSVFVKTISYYINTGYEIVPELYYQNPNFTGVITNSYKAALDRIRVDELIQTDEEPELTSKNPIGGSKKILSCTVDSGNGILNVKIYGDSQERVDRIAAAVDETVTKQHALLNQAIGNHSLELLAEEDYVDVDVDFGTVQTSFEDKIIAAAEGIEETKKDLKELKAPINKTPSLKSMIKKGVKFGVIGVAAGLILLVGYFLIRALIQDKVVSVNDINRRYNSPVLGTYCCEKKKGHLLFIDRFLLKHLGMGVTKTRAEQISFIASNIRFYLQDEHTLLLIGNCENSILETLKNELESELSDWDIKVGGNVNDNPGAVKALSGESNIICVEKMASSYHKDICLEQRKIRFSKNNNLGYIIVA